MGTVRRRVASIGGPPGALIPRKPHCAALPGLCAAGDLHDDSQLVCLACAARGGGKTSRQLGPELAINSRRVLAQPGRDNRGDDGVFSPLLHAYRNVVVLLPTVG